MPKKIIQLDICEKKFDPKRPPSLKQLVKKGIDYSEELFFGAVKNAFK